MVPECLRTDIGPLFAYLRRERATALQSAVKGLASPRHRQTLGEWTAFLEARETEAGEGAAAVLPVATLARARITKRYRSILKAGRKIAPQTADEALHALRIDCKKLRYLMEFFSSLFPPKKMRQLIGQLKKLQDNLGIFNDMSVQTRYLADLAARLPHATHNRTAVLLAIGSLMGALDREKALARESFAETFARFASERNQRRFRELFKGEQTGESA
jgi:CHAD domain-containing protein